MKKITDIDLKNKKVLIRCDLNVPIKDGKILDDNRIIESLETIKYVLKYASNVIIISHLGRIKTKEDLKNNSLKIVCERLSELLKIDVKFISYDEDINKIINENKIVMLENTRYFDIDNNLESNNDKRIAKFYSSLADVFVFDAFGVSHRNNASTLGITKYLPTVKGFLIEKEYEKLSELFNPEKPFTMILGGSKVKDKIGMIDKLIDKVNNIIIVGALSFTFLKARGYDVGESLVDSEYIPYALDLLNKYNDKIILPVDVYVSDSTSSNKKELVDIDNIKNIGVDVGPKTIKIIKDIVINSKTIFINGTPGIYENETFSYGTKELLNYLSKLNSKVIVGGGDSASAAIKFAKKDKFYHISTGGGATLELLSGKKLLGEGDINE